MSIQPSTFPTPRKWRFRIRDLMVAVAVVAGFFSLVRYVEFLGPLIALGVLAFLALWITWLPLYLWSSPRVRGIAGQGLLISTAFSTISAIYGDIYYRTDSLGWVVVCAMVVCFMPITLGFGLAWSDVSDPWTLIPRWNPNRSLFMALILVPLPFGLMLSNLPLRIAFYVSRPALDRLANRVASGEHLNWPVQAGMFRISGFVLSTENEALGLILDQDRYAKSEFLRDPNTDSHSSGHRVEPPFNPVHSDIAFDPHWCYREED